MRFATPTRGVTPPGQGTHATAQHAYADLVVAQHERVAEILEQTAVHGEQRLADAGAQALAGLADCTPLGAAVVAQALDAELYGDHDAVHTWVAQRGVEFAAEAVAWQAGLVTRSSWDSGQHRSLYHVRENDSHEPGFITPSYAPEYLRALLTDLPEQEYRAVVARLDALRKAQGGLAVRLTTSFLAPTETEWAAQDLAAAQTYTGRRHPFNILAASACTVAQFETLTAALQPSEFVSGSGRRYLTVALLRFGPDALPALERMLRHRGNSGHVASQLARIVARFPTDAAFSAMLAQSGHREMVPVLIDTARRFPHRAQRLLRPAAATSPLVRHLLRVLAHSHPELAPGLPPGVAFATGDHVADAHRLPEILRTPPWLRPRTSAKELTVPNLCEPTPARLAWLPGEREQWANLEVRVWDRYDGDWARHIAEALAENYYSQAPALFATAPEDVVRPHLRTATPHRGWADRNALRRILGRFDADGLPCVLRAVQAAPLTMLDILAPAVGTPITLSMIRWMDGKKTRAAAVNWFDRNLAAAAPDLIAAALAKVSKDRRAAETTLRVLAARGHRDELLGAAAAFEPRVATAVRAVLDTDPLDVLPATMPKPPEWLLPETLPELTLRGDRAALPLSAVREVCTMLALCGPHGDYPGVGQLIEAANPDSLAEFAWALLEQWRLAGYPGKDGWVLHIQGILGNDDTARRLAALIRIWPGESGHARAVSGLAVLTALGTDVALMQLHGIAEKATFKGLKTKAQERVAEVADDLGLTPEELSDRLVPDFGLNADGSLVLDYGPRGFVIGFDEQLKPTVSEAIRSDGEEWIVVGARKTVPKPGAKDDPELGTAAYKKFSALKKDVKSAAADQIRRFEQAMVAGRSWTVADHRRLFVEHPLVWHLSRRLVWVVFDSGVVSGSFRIAEDRSYADASDDPVTLPENGIVGIAHPLHLEETLGAWGELFADYEILQPFPQLQRETYLLTAEERAGNTLPRFQDLVIPTGKLLGMTRFDWERGDVGDGGVWCELYRQLGDGRSVVIDMEPGVYMGDAMDLPEQKITVRITDTGHEDRWHQAAQTRTFAGLEATTESELLRQLHLLAPDAEGAR
ncbi:DUF4132 domain-containing protein [Nocardia sp. 2]|uniref:DUF4132 domain-containing protein n=1 Tax=Nocardia acididurans TaxID=2802282 RepID=A0ABS1MI45_9NOCA|nr:DUF4132 domain-containing protein [Nocardia acididurans]MBL1080227.1 DUF4132 domain-containing protein [Nocardia acididurans]